MIPCAAAGWPRPTIRWKNQGDYLQDDMDYGIKPHPTLSQVTLEIRSANEDLEDQYDCEASNEFGKVEKSVYVRVIGKFYSFVSFSTSNFLSVSSSSGMYECVFALMCFSYFFTSFIHSFIYKNPTSNVIKNKRLQEEIQTNAKRV